MSDDDFRSFYFLMSSQREKTQHGVQSVVFCLEMYECHFVPWVTVSLDEWHCSVTRPAPLVYWLEALWSSWPGVSLSRSGWSGWLH